MDHNVTLLGHGLGHAYKHHLGARRLWAVAVVAALLAVAADLRLRV